MPFRYCIVFIALLYGSFLYAQQETAGRQLVFADDFEHALDTAHWKTEMATDTRNKVDVHHGKLVLDTKGGVTVWLRKKLHGNLVITYNRTVVSANGINDRVSDLNQFWMAGDPANPNLFTRAGVLEAYDSLRLYYVGMGGNTNTTTRFRKYEGNGKRTLLGEFTDSAHLLKPNVTYQIKIIVDRVSTGFWVNGIRYFLFTDPRLLREGYFGFRSTWSHQEIDAVRVYAW